MSESATIAGPAAAVDVVGVRTAGLGDTTYLLTHTPTGLGILVDPQRDVDRFIAEAEKRGARIGYVLETHVHNDYVSGGRELAARLGAALVVPAGAGVAFDHLPAFHLEDLDAGDGLAIRPIHTPGHTPEHLSYLVLLEGQPLALFSGGSLLVGSAGRPDLLGKARARQLARLQFLSAQRLARLPDAVGLYPTHGAGSFCTSGGGGRPTSTIGNEKRSNSVFQHLDGASYADALLPTLQPFPAYYAHMAPINVLGAPPLPHQVVPAVDPSALRVLQEKGVHVVDTRSRRAFAAGHVPGALGVEMADDFATWAGWLLPFNAPLVLVVDSQEAHDEALVQLARIGFEDIRGTLSGMDGWSAAGLPVATYQTASADELVRELSSSERRPQVLDVRSPGEVEDGTLASAMHRYLPDLQAGPPSELDPAQPVWTVCASGLRASIAAGILQRQGYRPIAVVRGGMQDVLEGVSERQRGKVAN